MHELNGAIAQDVLELGGPALSWLAVPGLLGLVSVLVLYVIGRARGRGHHASWASTAYGHAAEHRRQLVKAFRQDWAEPQARVCSDATGVQLLAIALLLLVALLSIGRPGLAVSCAGLLLVVHHGYATATRERTVSGHLSGIGAELGAGPVMWLRRRWVARTRRKP